MLWPSASRNPGRLHLAVSASALACALVLGACPDWDPMRGLTAGEGLQRSAPQPLAFEYGVALPARPDAPPYGPLGAATVIALEAPWRALRLATPGTGCIAVRIGFDEAPSAFGPLATAGRARALRLVLRRPAGDIVAELDAHGDLARCNDEAYDHHLLDLVDAEGQSLTGPLGQGSMRIEVHERDRDPEEAWRLAARATPFLVGRGIALWDPDRVHASAGPASTRQLEAYTPLAFALAPGECAAVTVALGPDAVVTPGLTMADAPFRFALTDRPDSNEVLHAHRVIAGQLVSDEVCNPSGDALAVELRLEPRRESSGDVPIGRGTLRLETYTRPLHPVAATTAWLAQPLAPRDPAPWRVVARFERRIEAFDPVPLAVPEGACQTVRVTLGKGARPVRGATAQDYPFVYRDGRGGSHLAQGDDGGVLAARPFCNEARTGPWPLSLELLQQQHRAQRSGARRQQFTRGAPAPGRGALTVEVLERSR